MHVADMLGSLGHGIGFMGDQYMGVTLGGSDIGVAQQCLHGPYIFCGHERIGGKGVAQVVESEILDPSFCQRRNKTFPDVDVRLSSAGVFKNVAV